MFQVMVDLHMSPPIFEDEEFDFLVYLISFIIVWPQIVSKTAQNAIFCNFDPPQSKNLTCWQKMKVIFEISTLDLAKNTYTHADLFLRVA